MDPVFLCGSIPVGIPRVIKHHQLRMKELANSEAGAITGAAALRSR